MTTSLRCTCGHDRDWHSKDQYACLECGCVEFKISNPAPILPKKRPFEPGDRVIRTGNFEFDPDLKPTEIYIVELCNWDGEEWLLKLKGNDFKAYDCDYFELATPYDEVAKEIFTPKDNPCPMCGPFTDNQLPCSTHGNVTKITTPLVVFEVFDDVFGDSLGIFGTVDAIYQGIADHMQKRTAESVAKVLAGTLASVKIQYEIIKHEVKT